MYAQRNTPANDLIALPEGTVYKQLPNGLHYVVKQNDIPGRKVEFRLILRAGSILQTDNEGGLAHFLEHMAFNGTKNFPDKGIVEYLESLGVKYGFGINAFTGFDRTIYMFSMPTDRPEELDKGLLILKDWLTGIEMNPDQVEREKGVILEEARGYDTGDLFYDLKVGKTRYSQRMPLGTAEEIKNILEAHKMDSSIYITLETLKYLKKGGRITPAAAAIGTMLKLNPVLQIQGEKLDAYAKARGKASAKKIMLKAMKEDMEKRFADYADTGRMHIEVAYTGNVEEAKEWAEAVKEAFPQFDFHMDPLSLSVACHIGYGSLAIATSAYVPEAE